jgi:GLTT repeat (6 copies)
MTVCLLTIVNNSFINNGLSIFLTSTLMDNNLNRSKKLKLLSIGIAPHDGIISIGISPHGLISIGAIPHGLVSIGLMPMGLVSIGLVSMGLFSAGITTMGLVGFGRVNMSLIQFNPFQTQQEQPKSQTNPNSHLSH